VRGSSAALISSRPIVGPPASRTGRGTHYRTRRPGAAVVAGELSPCQELGTAIMGHSDRPAALHLTFVECGLECMAPIMFMRRMMRSTILQRETRTDRQRGEKPVERGDTHALVTRCFRLEEKRRDRRFPDQKTAHPTSRPSPPTTLRIGSLRSRHCYRGYVKRARWWVVRTKLVPTTYRPRVWTTADQVHPLALEAHSSTAVGPECTALVVIMTSSVTSAMPMAAPFKRKPRRYERSSSDT
jgi:hypothetical protein